MELNEDLIKETNRILNEMLNNGPFSWFSINDNENGKKAYRICKSLNLVKIIDATTLDLDEKGVFAIQDGGIEKYLSNIRTEKDLDLTIKGLTSKRLKYDILYNIMYVLVGGLLGIMTSLVLPDKSKEYIKELNKSAFDKVELNDSFQKRLNDKNTLILSLKKEIDSLKGQ